MIQSFEHDKLKNECNRKMKNDAWKLSRKQSQKWSQGNQFNIGNEKSDEK